MRGVCCAYYLQLVAGITSARFELDGWLEAANPATMMLQSLHFPPICSLYPTNNPSPLPLSPPPLQPPPLLLRFRISHRENLRYLKTLKIIDPDTKPPSPETLDHILSTVNFFKSRGFSDSDFARLSFSCPVIFSSDIVTTEIEPVFDFLADELLASPEASRGLIIRCPRILLSDVEYCLRPTLAFLRKLGLEKLHKPNTLNANLLNTRVKKLQEKTRFLRSLGLSDEESAKICVRLPAIFRYSLENNLRPKAEYLVREMKRSVEELNVFPQYFAFSLERRIAPRHLHLEKKGVKLPLRRMLFWGDEKFYAKWK